jgi:hypothetical protein
MEWRGKKGQVVGKKVGRMRKRAELPVTQE